MTWAERGFYHWCLNYSWINNGLPAEESQIARAARMSPREFKKLWDIVGRCFTNVDGSYRNRRQEEERTYATTKSERATASVRTRYERNANVEKQNYERTTNDLPRALARESESESESDTKTKHQHHTNGAPPMPPTIREVMPNANSEFPLTMAEIRKHDQAVDEVFVRGLVSKTIQHCLSNASFPDGKISKITDANMARMCKESYATGPPKHGTGLLLSRVPPIAVSWAQEKKS